MNTALVFAGQSFVGRAVCATLRQLGARVVGTVRPHPSPPAPLPEAQRGEPGSKTEETVVLRDLTDHAAVAALVAAWRPDWVIQCAGATQTTDPWQLYSLHVLGTLGVLSAVAQHAPLARVVLLGSAGEYGPVPAVSLPVREDHPPRPLTQFAASKLAQTHLAAAFAREHRLRVATVRPFNILGPGLPEHYFAATLARRLLHLRATGLPGPIPVANLHATRDFVDVRDVADAVVAILTRAEIEPGEMPIYNIASGVETSLNEAATFLGQLAGGFVPVDGSSKPSRSGVRRSQGDPTLLRQATGWSARRTWRESLADLWADLA